MKKKAFITENIYFILDLIERSGYMAKVVGGAVRNYLLGLEISDIDIATTASPEAIIEVFQKNNMTTISIGAEFGTVIVMHRRKPYEITTLRKDVQTFGRKAKVEFTDSFEIDSQRRDFTINAIYMDKNGTISDYQDGVRDISTKTIRFIGNVSHRIAEDYLRILRYFRFVAKYGEYKFNAEYLDTINHSKQQLAILSSERILGECLKIFEIDDSYKIVPCMSAVLEELFGVSDDSLAICAKLKIFSSMSPRERLCMLLKFSKFDIHRLEKRYNFPRDIKEMLKLSVVEFELVFLKQKLKRVSKKHRKFYVMFAVVHAVFSGAISLSDAEAFIVQLGSYCDSGYADFNMKAADLAHLNLNNEQLKSTMMATREFWLLSDGDISAEDCIKFAEKYFYNSILVEK